MELRHLRYFMAVAEEENVTRAAARLHVSQPPLTRQIHDLERELGVSLFERHGRSIRLTEAGKLFWGEAKACLKRVDEAVETVRALAAKAESKLQVGYAPTPTAEIVPKILRSLQERFPNVQIVLHDHSSPEMLAGLRDGRLDAAFMMEPTKQAGRGVHFDRMQKYAVGIAAPLNHRLSRRKTVTVPELLAEPFVSYTAKQYPDYHEFVERVVGSENKRKLRIVQECESGPTLVAAVESGKGVSICSSVLMASSGRRLKFVPLSPQSAAAVVGLAYRTGRASKTLSKFIHVAKASTNDALGCGH